MTSLYDIANEIQARNDQIAKLEDENDEQISILWDELFRKLKSADEFLSKVEDPNCRKCAMFSGSHYGPDRTAYERYGTVQSIIKYACHVLGHYGENAFFRIENEKAVFGGEWTCYGETEYLSASIPVEWLDFSEDQIVELVKSALQKAEAEAARNIAIHEKQQEERERAKYEELKAKYEQE